MRANLAQSIGVASAAALLLPLVPLAPLATAAALSPSAASPSTSTSPSSSGVPGHTQSLSFGEPAAGTPGARAPGETGSAVRLGARTVRPYSLLGVVWDRAAQPLPGHVQVRTRDADSGRWSDWQQLDVHASGVQRAEGRDARGATAPLWVGRSDGVEARILPDRNTHQPLPEGLRLELVDPGPSKAPATGEAPAPDKAPGTADVPAGGERDNAAGTAPEGAGTDTGTDTGADTGTETGTGTGTGTGAGETGTGAETGTEPGTGTGAEPGTEPGTGTEPGSEAGTGPGTGTGSASAQVASGAVLPELSKEATQAQYPTLEARVGPRPRIVTRKGWGADEKLREAGYAYTKTVKAAFVHHTAMTNSYACSQAPSIIRAMYRYHVKSSKWRDIGYNFLVDKCGTIYEGRAGGVAKPVMGAHTYGFNTNSTGIAVLGSYDKKKPSKRTVKAIARLSAWKLGLFGVRAGEKTWLKSGGGNKFKKGSRIRFHAVSGHKDGYVTECPGARLYGKLGAIRTAAARLQGR
ncbi:peptidoglycan recognition protein family protein [Streptomyces sp. CA-250714]|uniref:peptidoglycan recognition protein family protein n=1 Tax=Streptomyces sp. CA-250714 TaxID=3240060 RepID=UPI003D8D7E19